MDEIREKIKEIVCNFQFGRGSTPFICFAKSSGCAYEEDCDLIVSEIIAILPKPTPTLTEEEIRKAINDHTYPKRGDCDKIFMNGGDKERLIKFLSGKIAKEGEEYKCKHTYAESGKVGYCIYCGEKKPAQKIGEAKEKEER